MLASAEAQAILRAADLVCPADAVSRAVRRVAAEISTTLAAANPLVLSVMSGAVVFTGQLLPLLEFPLDVDYIHLTRYGDATVGGRIEWKAFPAAKIAGRVVLIRYVFGFGMDVKGAWRNLPAVYAMKEA